MPVNDAIKDRILLALLPDVPFGGWTWAGAEKAAAAAGYDAAMTGAVFPGGIPDITAHFSVWADARMLEALETIDPASLRVRDRIREAVMARFEILRPHREAERLALAFHALPQRNARAARLLWRTADCIWTWAGDTATDYNRYTKRGLLCGVLGAATLAFLDDGGDDMITTGAFVDRRIENVMQCGRFLGRMKMRPESTHREK